MQPASHYSRPIRVGIAARHDCSRPPSPGRAGHARITDWRPRCDLKTPALRQLVSQLDADTLQARQQASDQLLAAGSRSIAPLVEALPRQMPNRHCAGLSILKKLVNSDDFETKRLARSALERLSRSTTRRWQSNPRPSSGRRTKRPFDAPRSPGQMMVGVPGGFRMFQVQMINGPATRRIVARENGQTVSITESPQDGIVIAITNRVNDHEQTSTIVAHTRDELEAKKSSGRDSVSEIHGRWRPWHSGRQFSRRQSARCSGSSSAPPLPRLRSAPTGLPKNRKVQRPAGGRGVMPCLLCS